MRDSVNQFLIGHLWFTIGIQHVNEQIPSLNTITQCANTPHGQRLMRMRIEWGIPQGPLSADP